VPIPTNGTHGLFWQNSGIALVSILQLADLHFMHCMAMFLGVLVLTQWRQVQWVALINGLRIVS
jgi:hypothetical protein